MRRGLMVLIVAMCGCAPGNPLPSVALSAPVEAAATDAIKASLKDPYSAQFERMRAGQDKDGSTLVCGYVNAKNSFGAYQGRRLFAVRVPAAGAATVEAFSDEAYAMGWCHRHNIMPA